MTIFVVAGLPGSGKSHLMMNLKEQGLIKEVIHDLYQGSLRKNNFIPDPEKSLYFDRLKATADKGESIAVADILFVIESVMMDFIDYVRKTWPDQEVEMVFMTNEPEVCKRNATERADKYEIEEKLVDAHIKFIDENWSQYFPEKFPDAFIAPCWGGDLWKQVAESKKLD